MLLSKRKLTVENVDNSKPKSQKKCSVSWQPSISLVNFVLRRDVYDVINDVPLGMYAKRFAALKKLENNQARILRFAKGKGNYD